MKRKGGSIGVFFIIFLFLTSLLQMPGSTGVMAGMVVTVNGEDSKLLVGDSMTVTVKVEDFDGQVSTPRDLVSVTLSVTEGTFEPASAITDVEGICTFTYTAPDEIEGPTDVTITAIAENGVLDPTGTDEVTVTYRLEGVIIGPSQVEAGGKSENYVLKVMAGGDPVPNVNVMPMVMGAGTLGTYSRTTNATGEAVIVIHPAASTGQINILIQIGAQKYFSTAASKSVNVVMELAPIELVRGGYHLKVDNWGCSMIGARVIRGSDPLGGLFVHFQSDFGYFIEDNVISDQNGYANSTFVASADYDYTERIDFTINISTNDGIESAYLEENMYTEERGVPGIFNKYNNYFDMYLKTIPTDGSFKGQLFPGESLVHEPRLIDDRQSIIPNPFVDDMSLVFELLDSSMDRVHDITIATGIDSISTETDREDPILEMEPMSVYEVPRDPVEGNYSWVYKLKSRNGVHTYIEFTQTWIVRGDYAIWVDDYTVSIHSEGKDDWTLIYYCAGDNDLTTPMDLELERLSSRAPDGEFKVYVLLHRDERNNDYRIYDGFRWDGARVWDLEAGRENSIDINDLEGTSLTYLGRLMEWVSYCSPSGHYGLILHDHGKGYKGMCIDRHMGYFTTETIVNVLSEFKRDRREAEMVVLSGCGMATIEVVSRLSPYTNYIVSPQQPTYCEHGLLSEKVLQNIKQYDWESSTPNALNIATDFLNGFIQESGGTRYDSTVCIIDTGIVRSFVFDINNTFRSIYDDWEILGECFSIAYNDTPRNPGPELGEYENGDMKSFLTGLRDEVVDHFMDPTARSVFNHLQEILTKWDDMVTYLHSVDSMNGLNLYMPVEPIPTDWYGFSNWEYDGIFIRMSDYYRKCLKKYNGWEEYSYDEDESDFTPLEHTDGHIIDDDTDGFGDRVVINLTPEQNVDQQPAYRMIVDCYQFSGNGAGYLPDMLKKRIVLEKEDIDGGKQMEITVPGTGLFTIMVRVMDVNGVILQKSIIGYFSMEATDPEVDPPSLEISASSTTITVGDDLELTSTVSDPDGDEVSLFWDFDHRDGVLFDSDEVGPVTRYLKPGNVTVTCVATDGEHTVVETIDIVVEAAIGNNAPSGSIRADLKDTGEATLKASSSDPDGDEMQYRFNFGDGNWTDWIDEEESRHHYSRVGTYNCSMKVRDRKGAISERSFVLVEVKTVSNGTIDNGEGAGSDDDLPVLIIAIIAIVAVAIVILALMMIVIFIIGLRKRKAGKEKGEVETW